MSYRDTGINALRDYQKSSLIPTLNALIAYLDKVYPGYVERFGEMASRVNRRVLAEKLAVLGKLNGMSYPSRAALNAVIFEVGGTIDSGKILREVASDTLDFSAGLFRNILIGVFVIGGAYVVLKYGRKK